MNDEETTSTGASLKACILLQFLWWGKGGGGVWAQKAALPQMAMVRYLVIIPFPPDAERVLPCCLKWVSGFCST